MAFNIVVSVVLGLNAAWGFRVAHMSLPERQAFFDAPANRWMRLGYSGRWVLLAAFVVSVIYLLVRI